MTYPTNYFKDCDNLKTQELKLKIRLELIYFALYGTIACYSPFLALYFKSRNLTYTQIGIAFAVNSLVGIFAQPLWGYVTDKYLNKKKTLLISSAFCSILIFNFVFARSFPHIIASIVLLLIFQSVTSPISDAYCYEIAENTKAFHFGEIRLAGSIGFALVSLALGKLIELAGINASFISFSVIFVINILLIYGVKFDGKAAIKRPGHKDVLDVVRRPKFLILVLSAMILNIALGANSSYVAILVQSTGGSTAVLGFTWFLVAVSEIPAFFFGGRLFKRYGELNLYLFATAFYILRYFLYSFNQGYTTIIALQLMQSITFPLYLMGIMQYVNKIVPEQIKASGITILSALGFGLGNLIGNLGGGILLETHDIFFLYRALSVVCLLSLLTGILLKVKETLEARKSVHPAG